MNDNLIENDLVKKAYELGFESWFGRMSAVNKDCYHLWMHDLHKWLRETYNIDVGVYSRNKDLGKFYGGAVDYNIGEINRSYGSSFMTYEEALEVGLREALNYLPLLVIMTEI